MEWLQFFGLIIAIGGLFFWNRSEANSDRRELRQAMDMQFNIIINNVNAIQSEMKDFHARLCVIEDRNKK